MPPYNDLQDKQNAKDALLAMAEQWRRAGLAAPDTRRYMTMIDENSDQGSGEESWEDEDEDNYEETEDIESNSEEDDAQWFQIRESPNKGVAVFALKDIHRGTRILTEKSLLDAVKLTSDYDLIPTFELWKKLPKAKQDHYVCLHPVEHMRQEILKKMIPRGRDEKMPYVVANMIAHIGAVFSANSFDDSVYQYALRFNHSCTPNCNQSPTDLNEGEMRIHAVRDINAGEELSVY